MWKENSNFRKNIVFHPPSWEESSQLWHRWNFFGWGLPLVVLWVGCFLCQTRLHRLLKPDCSDCVIWSSLDLMPPPTSSPSPIISFHRLHSCSIPQIGSEFQLCRLSFDQFGVKFSAVMLTMLVKMGPLNHQMSNKRYIRMSRKVDICIVFSVPLQ